MSDQRERLRSSRQAAQAAKNAFASRYASGRNDLAVGIGLNRAGSDWVVKVFAQSPAAAVALPDHFGDFDVDVEVTGTAKAY